MAKMLHLLLDWEYPHWMMVAGAILVAAGFIGRARESTPTERLKAIRESASADGQRKAKGK